MTGSHRQRARTALAAGLAPKAGRPRRPRAPAYGADVTVGPILLTVLGASTGKWLAVIGELVATMRRIGEHATGQLRRSHPARSRHQSPTMPQRPGRRSAPNFAHHAQAYIFASRAHPLMSQFVAKGPWGSRAAADACLLDCRFAAGGLKQHRTPHDSSRGPEPSINEAVVTTRRSPPLEPRRVGMR